MVSAFWAGAIQSFGKGFKEDYDQRKEQYQKYVDTGIETAKLMRPKIEEQRAKRDRLLGLQREWEKKYGIDGNTFSLLASKMDLDTLNQSLTTASQTLANNGQELDAEYVKRMFDLPDQITLPDGMTPEAAIDKAMGFYTSNLLSEKNPKSEGAKTRAGGKSVAQLIFMNPRAKADEALKGMNYAGYNVNDLVNYSMSGAGRRDIFTDTTIDTAGAGVTFDYDSSKDHAQTTTYIRRAFSDKLFGVEDIAEVPDAVLSSTTLTDIKIETDSEKSKEQAAIVKRNVNMSARLLADLEEEMVFDSRYSIPAGLRSRILGDIVDSVDSMEEFQTLASSIKSGKAAEYIINKVQAGEPLTGEDYDKIILNNFEDKDKESAITGASGGDDLESTIVSDTTPANASVSTDTKEVVSTGEDTDTKEVVSTGEDTDTKELTLAEQKAKEAAERAKGGTQEEVEPKEVAKDVIKEAITDPRIVVEGEAPVTFDDLVGFLKERWATATKEKPYSIAGYTAEDFDQTAVEILKEAGITEETYDLKDLEDMRKEYRTVGNVKPDVDFDDPTSVPGSNSRAFSDSPFALDAAPASRVSAAVGTGADRRPNNAGMMSRPAQPKSPDIEANPETQDTLSNLVDTGMKVHGAKSETAKLLKKVRDQATRGEKVKVSDITKLIRDTGKLPQTDTRDTLLMQLYELRDTLNKR